MDLGSQAGPLDLSHHRALAVTLEINGAPPEPGEKPVLNIQLEAAGKTCRDYYIDLDFSGLKTIILTEPGTRRTLPEFRPAYANYAFNAAMHHFDYRNVVALNLRWMRYPKGAAPRCRISRVEALEERRGVLRDCKISAGTLNIAIPGEMNTGEYAEYSGERAIRIFDKNGVLQRSAPAGHAPVLRSGDNRLAVTAAGSAQVTLTAITLGR